MDPEKKMNQRRWKNVRTPFAPVPVIAAMDAYRGRTLFGKSNFSVLTNNTGEEQEELAPNKDSNYDDVIVVHPGTSVWRIGRASDVFPKEFSNYVARPVPVSPDFSEKFAPLEASEGYRRFTRFDANGLPESTPWKTKALEQDLKLRLRVNKIRSIPQGHQLCTSWNQQSVPEIIPDHNDPNRTEWLEPSSVDKVIVGPKATSIPALRPFPPTAAEQLQFAESHVHEWCLFRPVIGGHLNNRDYVSLEACLDDVERVWTESLKSCLNLTLSELEDLKCVIVVPDLTDRLFVESMMNIALSQLRFRSAQPVQESLCASFGSGFSLCCVIDIGSSCTRVSCVEDGVVVPASRQKQPYGGDDITEFFQYLVRNVSFPYTQLDITQRVFDFVLLDQLKKKWCVADEFSLSMSVYDFFVREPHQKTKKYQVKLSDELINASMCLYFPQVVRFTRKLQFWNLGIDSSWYKDRLAFLLEQSVDAGLSSGPSAPEPAAGVSVLDTSVDEALEDSNAVFVDEAIVQTPVPLDMLILESLAQYAATVQELPDACDRVKKLVGTCVLVGGGGSMTGFAEHLEARLNLFISDWWASLPVVQERKAKAESANELTETLKHGPQAMVVQSPREIDPTVLVWKGAAVLGKLELGREMFTGAREWEDAGMERLSLKWLVPVEF